MRGWGAWVARAGLVVAMACAGCVTTGTVKEKAPLTADLATFKSASIELDLPDSVKNADTVKTQFQSQLGDKLRAKSIFAQVSPGGGDMAIRVRVLKVDTGNEAVHATGLGGDAEVSMNVDFVDVKQDKVVGTLFVTGNSKHQVKTIANDAEDTTATALGAAGDEIVAYLEKHRK
jgi:hypothetical protein